MRSFTLPPGLKYSIFARMGVSSPFPAENLRSASSGVFPISSVSLSAIFALMLLLCFLLHRLECLVEVGDNVFIMFCTDGEADGVRVDALTGGLLYAQFGVCGGERMDDE